MDDAVHVQIEIIELDAIGIGKMCSHRHRNATHLLWFLHHTVQDDIWELLTQPSKEGGYSLEIRADRKESD
jgi:hypothetical protein